MTQPYRVLSSSSDASPPTSCRRHTFRSLSSPVVTILEPSETASAALTGPGPVDAEVTNFPVLPRSVNVGFSLQG